MVGGLNINRKRVKARSFCAGCKKHLSPGDYKFTDDGLHYFCSDECMAGMGVKGDGSFKKKLHPNSSTAPSPSQSLCSSGHTGGYMVVVDCARDLVDLDKNLRSYHKRHGR